jgi:hypothetical protein
MEESKHLRFPFQLRVTSTRWLLVDTRSGQTVKDYPQSNDELYRAQFDRDQANALHRREHGIG